MEKVTDFVDSDFVGDLDKHKVVDNILVLIF